MSENSGNTWKFHRLELLGLALGLVVAIAFGLLIERRTALRRMPMTDLGAFLNAAAAVRDGENMYQVADWHGWHYHYPPVLAILLRPLSFKILPAPPAEPGSMRTAENTPWAYALNDGSKPYYGLHDDNLQFFILVFVWFAGSVVATLLAAHLLACTLERKHWRSPPPRAPDLRRDWWRLRLWPLLVCISSIGTVYSRGQVDILMLFAVSLALYLAGRGKNIGAGIFLSIPAAIKLLPPLILLLPIWWRGWKLIVGIVLGLFIFLIAIPVLVLGPGQTISAYKNWVEVLVKPGLGVNGDTSRAKELTGMYATDNQSVLFVLHNGIHMNLPHSERPSSASPQIRLAAVVVGGLLIMGFALASGLRKISSPQSLLIIAGILLGMTFLISPFVHSYYYLMLLPLVSALIAEAATGRNGKKPNAKWLLAPAFFMIVGAFIHIFETRNILREIGLPVVSLIFLMLAGVFSLRREQKEILHVNSQGRHGEMS